ncbi:hypothetical protein BH11MYX4_BH11MYX4_66930 [soil metagenome]
MAAPEHAPLSPVPFEVTEDDLAFALRACAGIHENERRIGDLVGDDEVLVTASARAAFDLVLEGLRLAPGDEVLFTPTIGRMPDLARERGLGAVFVDLDPRTLAPALASLEAALGPRARVLVGTHLFGARAAMGDALRLARSRGVVVVEDRAQAFHDPRDAGDPHADVVIHSFGVLKTASALGGGLLRVREPRLRRRVAELHDAWPEQPAASYARVVLGHLGARWLGRRRVHAAAVQAFERLGVDVDPLALRIVAPAPSARSRRQRPSRALLAVLARRLQTFTPETLVARREAVRRITDRLPPGLDHVGGSLAEHAHWVLPIVAPRPDALVSALRAAGLHATRKLVHLESAPATPATGWLQQIVYLPCFPRVDDAELARLLAVLGEHRGRRSHPECTSSSPPGTRRAPRASHRGCPPMP